MKKIFTIIVLATLTLTAVAQNEIKRVAILEIVDKLGTVPYMKQLMFRSNLTTAISNTPGYEGYDRVDVNQILGEQNFQRTGLVSDKDIKKIGEFTGAKYVLVAEAVIDGESMFITAKITDVETARVIRNSNQLMGLSPEELQTGSQKVSRDLLAPSAEEQKQLEAKRKAQEEALMQQQEEKRRINNLQQTLDKGYIKVGSFYVTFPALTNGNWTQANNQKNSCRIGGWSDWRFPTSSELQSIAGKLSVTGNKEMFVEWQYLYENSYQDLKILTERCIWVEDGTKKSGSVSTFCSQVETAYVILIRNAW